MSLNLKYRPTTLDEIRGNSDVVSTLEGLLSDLSTCPHSFIFYGQTGTGKTTLARIIADRLEIKGNDLSEINVADLRGIDTIREIIKQSQYCPLEGERRMWILDEFHKATSDAQNALLKILEEPSAHVYFIICTTDPQKLLSTIRGRCSQFQTKPLNEHQMYGLLRHVIKGEGEELTKEIYDQIIQNSSGLPRNALVTLEQVLSVSPEQRLEVAKQVSAEQNEVKELCRALLDRKSWKEVAKILEGLKDQEPESVRRAVLGYCQAVLLGGGRNDVAAAIIEVFWNPLYDIGRPGLTYACYSIINGK